MRVNQVYKGLVFTAPVSEQDSELNRKHVCVILTNPIHHKPFKGPTEKYVLRINLSTKRFKRLDSVEPDDFEPDDPIRKHIKRRSYIRFDTCKLGPAKRLANRLQSSNKKFEYVCDMDAKVFNKICASFVEEAQRSSSFILQDRYDFYLRANRRA